MGEKEEPMVKIRKGRVDMSVKRSNIMEVKQTHDGMVFNLVDGVHIYVTDTFMPNETKEKVILTFVSFQNVGLVFDLINYKTPARVVAK